jgi:hypothetical protein
MTTVLIVAFLLVHGLVHLAVWLPHPEPDPDKPPPFAPDHSAVLTATRVPQQQAHRTSVVLAVAAAAAYAVTALGVAFGAGWAVPVAVAAALVGLALKLLFFNPWLSLAVVLDALVLTAALWEWPLALV